MGATGSAAAPAPQGEGVAWARSRPGEAEITADPWAEAFAESSRLAGVPLPSPPAYPVVLNTQVQAFLDRFTGSRREVIRLWLGRSGRYLEMIRDVLRRKGMPEDLAYTAMIESGFNPLAVSRAGAKGMWQFMAGTARRYGLRVDRWIDERLDPEKSTVAAAAYLRDLYNLFGSWPLAQAAYNAGEVAVARAIRATGSTDFWTLARTRHLREETKQFVPQIHAAMLIGRDPDRYGFEFGPPEPLEVETLRVPPATDLGRLSAAARVPVESLRALNPVLVRGVTPPGQPWDLRVPRGTRDTLAAALAAPERRAVARGPARALRVARTGQTTAGGRLSDVHVVRPRDTISDIARRYGVSVGDVLRWNSLGQDDPIRPGDRLRVAADAGRGR